MTLLARSAFFAVTLSAVLPLRAQPPHYDHVVVVMEENRSFNEILGSVSPTPYLHSLAANGVFFTRSFAVTHPSQPNYIALFSGSTQGVKDDNTPAKTPFTTPNLAAALLAKGLTFAGFSEGLPVVGFLGDGYSSNPKQNQYVRKHCPWCNWQSDTPGGNRLPASVNLPFNGRFPTTPDGDFARLPAVAWVIPNEQHDMHDGTAAAADTWLSQNLAAYAEWAKTHNSLLIITWDEDDYSMHNQITTIFYGAHLHPGPCDLPITHYNVLRTIEDIFGLDPIGESANASAITGIFTTPDTP